MGERCEEGSEHIRGRGAKVGEVFFFFWIDMERQLGYRGGGVD